jgi:pimeloyl-ACP methyl ester carboxylesterase
MVWVDSAGVRLYAETTGTGSAIIWVHEFAADYRTWESQVRRFSRSHQCITYNARGYNPSDVPESGEAYDYRHHIDDLKAVLDHFAIERAHIVGLSMGAYTALQFAMRCPERVRSVFFASGGSGGVPGEHETYRREVNRGADRMLADGMEAGSTGLALGATRVQLLNKDPRGWEEFRSFMAEHSALGSALTLKNFQAERPSLFDYEEELRALDIPVLIAVGDEDDPVIETGIYLKRVLARAGLWICPRSGHGLNLEEPAEFNEQAARFFDAVELGRWGRRDERASPARSVFMGDKAAVAAGG